jgi:hypothetical protein
MKLPDRDRVYNTTSGVARIFQPLGKLLANGFWELGIGGQSGKSLGPNFLTEKRGIVLDFYEQNGSRNQLLRPDFHQTSEECHEVVKMGADKKNAHQSSVNFFPVV